MRISDWSSDVCSSDLPNARIYVTQEISDVTAQVVEGLDGMDGKARFDAIDAREKALVAACEEPGGLRCNVYSFNGGPEASLIRQGSAERRGGEERFSTCNIRLSPFHSKQNKRT